MTLRWIHLCKTVEDAPFVRVLSAGTCNYLDEYGKLRRNTHRDRFNERLNRHGIDFTDPQVHPTTHDGMEYVYEIHGPIEQLSRQHAEVLVYEISDTTLGGVTMMEVMRDGADGRKIILYFSAHDPKVFNPMCGSKEFGKKFFQRLVLFFWRELREKVEADKAFRNEMIKNGVNMRKYLLEFAKSFPDVTICTTDEELWDALVRKLGIL